VRVCECAFACEFVCGADYLCICMIANMIVKCVFIRVYAHVHIRANNFAHLLVSVAIFFNSFLDSCMTLCMV